MSTKLLGCIVFAALGLGGFAGAVVAVHASSPPLVPSADRSLARSVSSLATDLAGLESRLAFLEQRPAAAERAESAPVRRDEPSAVKVPEPKAANPAVEKEAAIAAAAKELAPRFEKLALDDVPPEELKKLLDEVSRKGQQDGAVAALEALIEKNPRDAKLHYILAKACYARLMLESTPAGYQKWGDRTVKGWEQAIELDPDYWEPRFERAEYNTYFPESEGKTPEVIGEFEKLIARQGGSTSNPRYSRSYAHLSRMYLRVGKRDKAVQTLKDGAALFPDDAELRKQLDVLQKE